MIVANSWNHVEIEFSLGTEKPGYHVKIAAPGQTPIESGELAYGSPWFYLCNALYFVGCGQKPGRFYLDNVVLERLTAE